MYVNEGDLNKAEEFFIKALETEPENALVPYLLAIDVYIPQMKWAKMNDMFNRSLEINPDAKLPQFYMVDDELIRTVSQAIAIKREQEWSKIFNAGVDHMNGGDQEKAIEYFTLAMKVLPDDGQAYKALYSLYLRQGKSEEAVGVLEKAPEDFDILLEDNYYVLQDSMAIKKSRKIGETLKYFADKDINEITRKQRDISYSKEERTVFQRERVVVRKSQEFEQLCIVPMIQLITQKLEVEIEEEN
jgi:tetratricopeptide (TPR) repeat protein